MQSFREMACKEVEAGQHQSALVLAGAGNVFLYQAYLGRVHASVHDTINVFVDDYAVAVGTASPLKGDVDRTWYDGISYASVTGLLLAVSEHQNIPIDFALSQNYPNPFNPSTQIKYAVPSSSNVSLIVYDVLGRSVATLVNGRVTPGYHTATWNASSMASGVYFARLTVNDEAGYPAFNKVSKLVLVK
jgi:hypothetical protein